LGGIAEEHPYLAVLPLARRACVLACYSDRLLALLQKTALVYDQDAAVFIAEMLEDILAQVIADGIRIPVSVIEEVLDSSWPRLADGFGHLPRVFAPDLAEQPAKVAIRSLSDLGPQEAVRDARMQLFKVGGPLLKGSRDLWFVPCVFGDHLAPLPSYG